MQVTDYISISALVISIISLVISWYFGFRDKAHIKTFAKFYPYNPNYDQARIFIKIVNCGRRPIIITMFGGDLIGKDLKGRHWSATYLGEEGKGIRLEEHEKYETTIYIHDIYNFDPEGNESECKNFWFENTLGHRFKVVNSEKLIKKLKETGSF